MTQHYYAAERKIVPVPNDPISCSDVSNAHNHFKNHTSGTSSTEKMLQDLLENINGIETIYPSPLHLDKSLSSLNISLNDARRSENLRRKSMQFSILDYQRLLENCLDLNLPLILIESDPSPIGYYWHHRTLDRMMLSDREAKNKDELRQEFNDFWFHQNQDAWQSSGLVSTWDHREKMALDIRPFDRNFFPSLGLDRPYMHVNCQELWNLAPDVIQECFDYLEIPIINERWSHWLAVATRWQKLQHQNLRFYHEVNHIVDAIVNNWYYPLPVLELWQEAIIQHCLIYQHDLNLKTWQLDRFPDNTQKLHQLLESNIHKVPKIY